MGDDVPLPSLVGGCLLGLSALVGAVTALVTAIGWLASVVGWIASDSFVDTLATAATIAGFAYILGTTVLTLLLAIFRFSWTDRGLGLLVWLGSTAFWLFLVILPWNEPVLRLIGGVCLALGTGVLVFLAYGSVEDHRRLRRKKYKECPDCGETVKSQAKVCRYCGYRFVEPDSPRRSAP